MPRVGVTTRFYGLFVALVTLGVLAWVFGRADALFVAIVLLTVLVGAIITALTSKAPPPMHRDLPGDVIMAGEQVPVFLRLIGAGVGIGGGAAGAATVTVGSTGLEPRSPQGRRSRPGTGVVDYPVLEHTPWGIVELAPTSLPGVVGYLLIAPRRGRHVLGPAVAEIRSPLALAARRFVVAPASELLVAPSLLDIDVPPLRFDTEESAATMTSAAERITDPSAVRQYRPGDPRRLVHWRATARRDQLMVREDLARAETDVWLLVDTVSTDDDAFELVVSAAASIAAFFVNSHHRVHVAQTGPAQDLSLGTENALTPAGGTQAVLRAFARVGPEGADAPEWETWVDDAVPTRGGAVPVYAVLSDISPARAPALRRVAAFADPAVAYTIGPAADADLTALAAMGWSVAELDLDEWLELI